MVLDPLLLIVIALAIIWMAFAGRELDLAIRTSRWPQVQGSVVAAFDQKPRSTRTPVPRRVLNYTYTVLGSEYAGVGAAGRWIPDPSLSPREQRVGALEAGQPLSVYYDPADPSRSVLQPGATPSHWFALLAPAAILLLFLAGSFWLRAT